MNLTKEYLDSKNPELDNGVLIFLEIEEEIKNGNLGKANKIYQFACNEFKNLQEEKPCLWDRCQLTTQNIEGELFRLGSGLVLLKAIYTKKV